MFDANWVDFCEELTPNTWDPCAVGKRCKGRETRPRLGSAPSIHCFSDGRFRECFTRAGCRTRKVCRRPSRSPYRMSRRRSRSYGNSPSPSRYKLERERQAAHERMCIPDKNQSHVLKHMRCECRACVNFARKWGKAILKKYSGKTRCVASPTRRMRRRPISLSPVRRRPTYRRVRSWSPSMSYWRSPAASRKTMDCNDDDYDDDDDDDDVHVELDSCDDVVHCRDMRPHPNSRRCSSLPRDDSMLRFDKLEERKPQHRCHPTKKIRRVPMYCDDVINQDSCDAVVSCCDNNIHPQYRNSRRCSSLPRRGDSMIHLENIERNGRNRCKPPKVTWLNDDLDRMDEFQARLDEMGINQYKVDRFKMDEPHPVSTNFNTPSFRVNSILPDKGSGDVLRWLDTCGLGIKPQPTLDKSSNKSILKTWQQDGLKRAIKARLAGPTRVDNHSVIPTQQKKVVDNYAGDFRYTGPSQVPTDTRFIPCRTNEPRGTTVTSGGLDNILFHNSRDEGRIGLRAGSSDDEDDPAFYFSHSDNSPFTTPGHDVDKPRGRCNTSFQFKRPSKTSAGGGDYEDADVDFPACRPFCASDKVIKLKPARDEDQWLAHHVDLMTECGKENHATSRERSRRVEVKAYKLRQSMETMRLDFGDIEKRLHKMRKLQRSYLKKTGKALAAIQERNTSPGALNHRYYEDEDNYDDDCEGRDERVQQRDCVKCHSFITDRSSPRQRCRHKGYHQLKLAGDGRKSRSYIDDFRDKGGQTFVEKKILSADAGRERFQKDRSRVVRNFGFDSGNDETPSFIDDSVNETLTETSVFEGGKINVIKLDKQHETTANEKHTVKTSTGSYDDSGDRIYSTTESNLDSRVDDERMVCRRRWSDGETINCARNYSDSFTPTSLDEGFLTANDTIDFDDDRIKFRHNLCESEYDVNSSKMKSSRSSRCCRGDERSCFTRKKRCKKKVNASESANTTSCDTGVFDEDVDDLIRPSVNSKKGWVDSDCEDTVRTTRSDRSDYDRGEIRLTTKSRYHERGRSAAAAAANERDTTTTTTTPTQCDTERFNSSIDFSENKHNRPKRGADNIDDFVLDTMGSKKSSDDNGKTHSTSRGWSKSSSVNETTYTETSGDRKTGDDDRTYSTRQNATSERTITDKNKSLTSNDSLRQFKDVKSDSRRQKSSRHDTRDDDDNDDDDDDNDNDDDTKITNETTTFDDDRIKYLRKNKHQERRHDGPTDEIKKTDEKMNKYEPCRDDVYDNVKRRDEDATLDVDKMKYFSKNKLQDFRDDGRDEIKKTDQKLLLDAERLRILRMNKYQPSRDATRYGIKTKDENAALDAYRTRYFRKSNHQDYRDDGHKKTTLNADKIHFSRTNKHQPCRDDDRHANVKTADEKATFDVNKIQLFRKNKHQTGRGDCQNDVKSTDENATLNADRIKFFKKNRHKDRNNDEVCNFKASRHCQGGINDEYGRTVVDTDGRVNRGTDDRRIKLVRGDSQPGSPRMHDTNRERRSRRSNYRSTKDALASSGRSNRDRSYNSCNSYDLGGGDCGPRSYATASKKNARNIRDDDDDDDIRNDSPAARERLPSRELDRGNYGIDHDLMHRGHRHDLETRSHLLETGDNLKYPVILKRDSLGGRDKHTEKTVTFKEEKIDSEKDNDSYYENTRFGNRASSKRDNSSWRTSCWSGGVQKFVTATRTQKQSEVVSNPTNSRTAYSPRNRVNHDKSYDDGRDVLRQSISPSIRDVISLSPSVRRRRTSRSHHNLRRHGSDSYLVGYDSDGEESSYSDRADLRRRRRHRRNISPRSPTRLQLCKSTA